MLIFIVLKKYLNLQIIQQKLNNTYSFDLRSFALFRIVFGFVLMIDLCIRLSDLNVFYTEQGILPLTLLNQHLARYLFLPIYQLNDTSLFVSICFGIHLIAVFCFAIGYRTKLFQIIALLFYISLTMRGPYILQGGDDLIRCMLFFGLFLPLNAKWAIQTKEPQSDYTIAALVFMFQILMVYWVSAFMKTSNEWHADGTALYYAFNLDCIQWPLAKYLLQFPALLNVLTHVVLYMEFLIPLLFFMPFKNNQMRNVGIIVLLLFQIGIASTLFVGLFYLINITALILLIPKQLFDKLDIKNNQTSQLLPFNFNNNFLVITLLIYVLIWNAGYMPQFKYGLAKKLKSFAYPIGINQNWGMFAPDVFKDDGWFIYEAQLVNGDTIDLKNNCQKVNYNKPESILSTIKNDRWRKFSEHVVLGKKPWLNSYYVSYILRNHVTKCTNKHPAIKRFSLIYMKETTPKLGDTTSIEKVMLTN